MRKLATIISTALLLASCDMNTLYHQYRDTPLQGWEKNDTLTYDISPVIRQGVYASTLGIRINGDYPFTSLSLIVEKTIYPSHEVITDTIKCRFVDDRGKSYRQGTSHFQFTFPAGYMQLQEKDSIHITIRHCMKRDILPGISDVGLEIRRRE